MMNPRTLEAMRTQGLSEEDTDEMVTTNSGFYSYGSDTRCRTNASKTIE
jgi:hypothetical protein